MWGAISDERTGLLFKIAARPRQRSQSYSGLSSAGLVTIFYCLRIEIPQPGEPEPHIYIPQEQGDPVIPPSTGFSFRRLLRLAGLRWRYSKPPPHGVLNYLSKVKVTLQLTVSLSVLVLSPGWG
jgi:hypothetical protein